MLSRVDGERLLTDLRHVGQSLHQVAIDERLGLVALLTWLREQMADDKVEVAADRTRRLDSDAAAVQLVTIHGSKGLEYPVVYLPTLWDRYSAEPGGAAVPLPAEDGAPTAASTSAAAGRSGRTSLRRARAEDDGESLRLLYVALTRARSQVVAWWAPAPKNTPCSRAAADAVRPPARTGADVPAKQELHPEDDVVRDPRHLTGQLGGPSWEESRQPDAARRRPARRRAAAERAVGSPGASTPTWRRTSYSSLSAAADRAEPAAPAPPWAASRRSRPRTTSPTCPSVVPADPAGGPRRVRGRGALADGGRSRSGRRSARWCTPCSSTPTRLADDLRAELLDAGSTSSWCCWPVALDPEAAGRRARGGVRQPARPAGRGT